MNPLAHLGIIAVKEVTRTVDPAAAGPEEAAVLVTDMIPHLGAHVE